MAKKKKDDVLLEEDGKGSAGSKVLTIIITIIIILIWLAVFAVLIRFDVGGFGSGVLKPVLKNVPIVNKILPPDTDEETIEETGTPYKSMKEALDRIKELELELSEQGKSDSSKNKDLEELQAEVDRLKKFEENQLDFEKRVKEFEKNVVFADNAPPIEEYKAYYEGIDPTNAEEIYRQVVEQTISSQKIKDQAAMFAAMKPDAAAAILETMTGDLDLVSEILSNMKTKQSGPILAAMDETMAARVTKKMSLPVE